MIPIVTFRSAAVQSGVPEEEPDEPEELEEEPVPVPEDGGSAAPLGAVGALAPAGALEVVAEPPDELLEPLGEQPATPSPNTKTQSATEMDVRNRM